MKPNEVNEDFFPVPGVFDDACAAIAARGSLDADDSGAADTGSDGISGVAGVDQLREKPRMHLSFGGYSSGAPAHAHGAVWSLVLAGRERVLLFPPGALGAKRTRFSEPGQGTVLYSSIN